MENNMKYILAFFNFILFIILSPFLIVRTLLTKPKSGNITAKQFDYELDKDTIAKHLSEAVKIPTVSMTSPEYPPQPFYDLKNYLENTYPTLHKSATITVINGFSLVYHIKGTNESNKPIAILAHQDVVPAPPQGWEVPPFSGEIKDGFVYGRGSQDMKNTLIAVCEAMEYLLNKDTSFNRDIYLCFGHDEEPNTVEGAPKIVEWLKSQNITLESVFDEGGAMLNGSLLGIDGTVALVGASEKGYVDIEITTKKNGGHASNPNKASSVTILAKTIDKIMKTPMKATWTPATKQTFKTLSPHMNFLFKLLFVNRAILSPLLKLVLSMIPITNALIRTTFAATTLVGSGATNVIPPKATCNINCRIQTGESVQDVVDHMSKIAHKIDPNTSVTVVQGNEPTPYAPSDTNAYKIIEKTILELFDNTVPAPFTFIAASDSRYFYPVCDNVYRFTPFMFSIEDTARIHALNERCSIDDMHKATVFFIRYILNCTN